MLPDRIARVMITLWLLPLLAACSADSIGPGNPMPLDLTLAPIASGLDFPLYLTSPPGDTHRLFVVEKTGRVRIVKNGVLLDKPFLDLHDIVSSDTEQGLLAIAFDPNYSANRRLFVSYTDVAGNSRIVRYLTAVANPDSVDPASGDTILAVVQPRPEHNNGLVAFGPDGYLYVDFGDGGGFGDPDLNGQNLTTLLGKILRLNVSGARSYTIPAGNPFVGGANRGEIWSYGLRNPWRWSFDRSTHDLYIGDVGQNSWEEIDVTPGGAGGRNYGWSVMEGLTCYNADNCDQTGLTLPVVVYGHGQGCAVTGGYVYRGAAIPQLRGTYFYGDFCEGWVKSFRFSGGAATQGKQWPSLAAGGMITSFGEDAAGEIYIITSDGRVQKVVNQ